MHKTLFTGLLIASSVVLWSGCTSPDNEPIEEQVEVEEEMGTEEPGLEGEEAETGEPEIDDLDTDTLGTEPLPNSNITD